MSPLVFSLLICLLPLVAVAAWERGHHRGEKRGYDAGWVDHQLDTARRDRERRDKAGRFKSLKAQRRATGGRTR